MTFHPKLVGNNVRYIKFKRKQWTKFISGKNDYCKKETTKSKNRKNTTIMEENVKSLASHLSLLSPFRDQLMFTTQFKMI